MICTTIIPTINRPTLERTVRSAVEQSLDPTQHEILVFNNSDAPLPEVSWLRAPKIRVIDLHSNVIEASNNGAAMARSKYINFLHDDDYLLPDALSTLIEAAEASDCCCAYGAYELVDDSDRRVCVIPAATKGNMFAWFISGEVLHFACSLIRRDIYLLVGGLDRQFTVRPDLDLLCQMALHGDFQFTSQVVAVVRRSGGPKSCINFDGMSRDHRELREKALNSPLAFCRMRDSIGQGVVLRGRACRAYLASCILNLLSARVVVAWSRLVQFLHLAGCSLYRLRFWHVVLRWPRVGLEW
jgi:glycosyltransferase involved in cell wall biosynthesis